MGLLDDAIREHLDLKRRRGADPAEVERAEREALGPVRRVAEGREESELELGHPADDDDGHPAETGEPTELHEPFADHVGHVEPQPQAPEPEFEQPPEAPAEPPPPQLEHQPEAPAPAAAHPAEPAPTETKLFNEPEPADEPVYDHAGDETVEYDVEQALEAEPSERGEDVLEETPEFLQDTPDHDRLWFEQKPPRDFDFDG
jgi:hypothetical protein